MGPWTAYPAADAHVCFLDEAELSISRMLAGPSCPEAPMSPIALPLAGLESAGLPRSREEDFSFLAQMQLPWSHEYVECEQVCEEGEADERR
jgi:hypothetical protein